MLKAVKPGRVHAGIRRVCMESERTISLLTWVLQATDSIVDFAVKTGKPFAVVPCCVFPRLFRHRRLPCAAAVVTRDAGDDESASQAVEGMHGQLHESSNSSSYPALNGLPEHGRDSQSVSRPGHCLARPSDESQSADWLTDRESIIQHPTRIDAEGEAVITHEQLILYLQHMGGLSARTAWLPFDGMNTVVYRLP